MKELGLDNDNIIKRKEEKLPSGNILSLFISLFLEHPTLMLSYIMWVMCGRISFYNQLYPFS